MELLNYQGGPFAGVRAADGSFFMVSARSGYIVLYSVLDQRQVAAMPLRTYDRFGLTGEGLLAWARHLYLLL